MSSLHDPFVLPLKAPLNRLQKMATTKLLQDGQVVRRPPSPPPLPPLVAPWPGILVHGGPRDMASIPRTPVPLGCPALFIPLMALQFLTHSIGVLAYGIGAGESLDGPAVH
jgi:hypothetical protein